MMWIRGLAPPALLFGVITFVSLGEDLSRGDTEYTLMQVFVLLACSSLVTARLMICESE